ncbi:MAG: primosomal protein N' [Alphaproteobacteria bacterium]|nr:primosomal protein N' [Alphaproteobacteria bacterium]
MFVGVLLPMPFNAPFDYQADAKLPLGTIVKVPFGRETMVGVVWQEGKTSKLEDKKIKKVTEVIPCPPLKSDFRKFLEFTASYNMAPLGLVLKMALSVRGVFEDSQMLKLYELSGKTLSEAKLKNSDARWRVLDFLKFAPFNRQEIASGAGVSQSVIKTLIDAGVLRGVFVQKKKEYKKPICGFQKVNLTSEQKVAADNLCSKVGTGFSVTLLNGVTGSGKTEVYFEAVEKAFAQGKQVLIMVPEIGLTAQWLKRFEKRFGVIPAEWHSALTPKERVDNWKAAVDGEAKIIVGARSALFLPYPDLGLIVIDESHDASFKQEDAVNYQGRDMAVVRAKCEQIPLILSTATPDLETVCNVDEGKYDEVKLVSRYAKAELPDIKIIDLRKDKPVKGSWGTSWLSPTLCEKLKQNYEKGEQSVLFLNRRGYAPLIICRDCGHRIQCPHCTSWLTEHLQMQKLVCHHCGYMMPIPHECPECHSETGLTACGPGVERIAEEVKYRFPLARTKVLSSDFVTNFKEVKEVVDEMEKGQIDILIGTQILAKGHHFPELTLVGIVDADHGLMGSELRAAERTYQLLSQVSGRAGRGCKKGEVYLQTLYPENAVLKALTEQKSDDFYDLEKQTRRILKMPPFGKLVAVIVSGAKKADVEKMAIMLGKTAFNDGNVVTLGPAPAPVFLLRNKYRYRLLVKTPKTVKIQQVLEKWLRKVRIPQSVRVEVDIDPYSFY